MGALDYRSFHTDRDVLPTGDCDDHYLEGAGYFVRNPGLLKLFSLAQAFHAWEPKGD